MTEEVSLFYKQRLWHDGNGISSCSNKFIKYPTDHQKIDRKAQLTYHKDAVVYLSDPIAPVRDMRRGITLRFSTSPSIHSSFPGCKWAILNTSIHLTSVEFHYKTKWAVETTKKS